MKILEEKIKKEGLILQGNILKVDGFINHQVDPKLMKQIGEEFASYFKEKQITKVVTIESSEIAPALMTALTLNVPMIILKKQTSKILQEEFYQIDVISYTKAMTYQLTLSKKYIHSQDNILIIDDFLANGEAASGAIRLVEQAGGKVAGLGMVIEKSFQRGREKLEQKGLDIYLLARIKEFKNGKVIFIQKGE